MVDYLWNNGFHVELLSETVARKCVHLCATMSGKLYLLEMKAVSNTRIIKEVNAMAEDTISALSVYYIYSTVSEAQKHTQKRF
jgi:Holliday junction resolvase